MTEQILQNTESVSHDDLLAVEHITKKFGLFAAVNDVSLTIGHGQIHALLGENGAGKSTLVKVIYGALQPTAGQLHWRGKLLHLENPAAARRQGIAMVFQHFSLFEALTVVENVALALPVGTPMPDLARRIETISRDYGLPLSAEARVADLSVGERQRIEIVRCLLQDPALLIMDEPTAVLTPQEADDLFRTLRRLAADGCAILYISHRLEEVRQLCHAVTILRHGKVVARLDPSFETAATLARHMVGDDIRVVANSTANAGPEVLRLQSLSLPADSAFGVALKELDLSVHSGEVVAIAGIAGNGQSELFASLSGEAATAANMITIAGAACGDRDISERRAMGAAFVPEERLGHGAVPEFSLSDNVVLTRYRADDDLIKTGLLQRGAAQRLARRVIDHFDVRKHRQDPEARSLSGGNLQKFVVGRELDRKPQLLIINQPTWGVDAGAAAAIRQALIDLARTGSAVLLISQDLDEIFATSDRVAVISRGQLSPAVPLYDTSPEAIGLLMAGAHERPVS
jgi:simple sugar transport system ATP-binding protein